MNPIDITSENATGSEHHDRKCGLHANHLSLIGPPPVPRRPLENTALFDRGRLADDIGPLSG